LSEPPVGIETRPLCRRDHLTRRGARIALPRVNIDGTDAAESDRGIDEKSASERNMGWVRWKGNIFDGRTNKQRNTVRKHSAKYLQSIDVSRLSTSEISRSSYSTAGRRMIQAGPFQA